MVKYLKVFTLCILEILTAYFNWCCYCYYYYCFHHHYCCASLLGIYSCDHASDL